MQSTDDTTTQFTDDASMQNTDDTTMQITDTTTQITDDTTTQSIDNTTTHIAHGTTMQITDDQPDSSIIQPIAESSIATNLPPSNTIVDYFDSKYRKLDGTTLLARAKQIFLSMKVSDCECRLIERSTKQQRECDDWFMYRKGRITASSFHDIYVLKAQTDPKKLINKILLSPNLSQQLSGELIMRMWFDRSMFQ